MTTEEVPIETLLDQLVLAADDQIPAEVYALTTKILAASTKDDDQIIQNDNDYEEDHIDNLQDEFLPDVIQYRVQQTHCRALIAMKEYNDVIAFCSNLPEQNERDSLLLERTYALYKLGRYAACRDTIFHAAQRLNMGGMEDETVRGLEHLLAQCHYRLMDTKRSTSVYGNLIKSGSAKGYDEDSEIVTNAMAASSANHSLNVSQPALDLFKSYFDKELDAADANADGEGGELDYPYEMVNNYATNLLQTSSSLSQTKHAMELLETAKAECEAIFEDADQDDDDADVAAKSQMKETMPIDANIALGKILTGDLNGAMRSYLQLALASKPVLEKDASFHGGGGILAMENNMVLLNLLRGSSHSVYDLLKKLPDISSASESSTGKNTSVSPNNAINPCQIRVVLYNRVLLYCNMGKMTEARHVLQTLKSSISMREPNAKGGGTDDANSRGKKKKRKNASGTFLAPPASEAETLFWECRVGILESEISKDATMLEALERSLKGFIDKINEDEGKEENDRTPTTPLEEKDTLEYALAELKLYQTSKAIQESSTSFDDEARKKQIVLLESLPPSIRSRPATIASLCSLYRSLGMNDKVESTLEVSANSGLARKGVADFKLRLGMYDEAVAIYESIISGEGSEEEDAKIGEEELMECTAGLVKALSHIDMERAIDMSSDLIIDESSDMPDGEELEAMEIPRLYKGAGTTSGRSHKIIRSRGSGGYVILSLFVICVSHSFPYIENKT